VGTEAALVVVFPVAGVLLVRGEPVHNSLAVSFVVFPLALVEVAAGVGHAAGAPLHSTFPSSGVDRIVLIFEVSLAVTHALLPISFIDNSLFLIVVLAFAVSQAVQDSSFVGACVGPLVLAVTGDLILSEFAFVDGAVMPFELASAVEETVLKLSFENMAVLELAVTLPVVHFADLSVLLIVDDVTRPFFDH